MKNVFNFWNIFKKNDEGGKVIFDGDAYEKEKEETRLLENKKWQELNPPKYKCGDKIGKWVVIRGPFFVHDRFMQYYSDYRYYTYVLLDTIELEEKTIKEETLNFIK